MRALNANLKIADVDSQSPPVLAGMHSARVVLLTPQKLYRFSSQKTPVICQPDSPWWFAERDFAKLRPYLDLDKENPGFVARIQGAVCYEWGSDMDMLLIADLLQPINVFQGPGVWQIERTKGGSTIVWQAPQDLYQTYIPGLSGKSRGGANPDIKRAVVLKQRIRLQGPDKVDASLKRMSGKTIIMPGNPAVH